MNYVEEKIRDNTFAYLNNISNHIPDNLLKSHYGLRLNLLASREQLKLPAKYTSGLRCSQCLLPFTDCPPRYHIEAEKKLSSFGKKVLKKETLTEVQKTYKQKLITEPHNTLVLECGFCKKKLKKIMPKNTKSIVTPDSQTDPQKKIKKKKKDRSAGLNLNAVLSVQKHDLNTNEMGLNILDRSKSKTTEQKMTKTSIYLNDSKKLRELAKLEVKSEHKKHKIGIKKAKDKLQSNKNKLSNALKTSNEGVNKKSKLSAFLKSL